MYKVMIMKIPLKDKVKIFKALSDENRLRILKKVKFEEFCLGTLAKEFGLSASVASHHLKALEEAGLVHKRKDGRYVVFKINKQRFKDLLEDMFEYLINEDSEEEEGG